MDLILSVEEVRVLGCLIEKEATTPDVYPLSLNSLVTACNQKSNRDPVMELEEADVIGALDSLADKTLVSTFQSSRNRMPKYQHKLRFRAFDEFNFNLPQLAVLGTLFLRGPQTLGEIRTRCARIHEFSDTQAVDEVLKSLEEHVQGPYAKVLPRQPGRKESRYTHLFCGDVAEDTTLHTAQHSGVAVGSSNTSRIDGLESELAELTATVQRLEQRLEEFVKQFE